MKKAFTLVELLAVIVVLGIVLAITVPSIQSYINNSKSNVYDVTVNELKRAAKSYVEQYSPVMDSLQTSGVDFVTIQQMVDKGFLKAPINNPQTGTEFNYNGAVKVVRNASGYFDFNFYINGVTDTVRPVLTLLGNATVTIEAGSTYVDAGATAIDDVSGNITSNIVATSNLIVNTTGTYTMTYNVSDAADNPAYAISRTIIVVDTTAPIVAFSPNGNNIYAKTRSTTVTASDGGIIDASSLKYQWTTSASAPSEGSFSTAFTNGGSISTSAGLNGGYYLWILAKDNKNNTSITGSNVFNLDNISPVITMNGSSPIYLALNASYTDAGAIATDNADGTITSSIIKTSTVNVNVTGVYTVTYNVNDSSGNAATPVVRTVYVGDSTPPTVAFGANGNSTYAKTRSTTVTVTDSISGVNTSSLKYQWTTSTTAPLETSFSTTFTNGGSISSPAGVSGGYYLWILAKDNMMNTSITRSNVFNLDNSAPVIAMNGSTPVTVYTGSTYTDAGATATDNVDSSVTVNVTSTVNINLAGSYTVTYNASDSLGNAATPVVRTVNVQSLSSVEYLIVAGGGGSGHDNGSGVSGGGGGGGVLSGTFGVSISSYTVTVGAGGIAGASGGLQGGNGGNSAVFGITATGGGGGGGQTVGTGLSGGSGGGGGVTASSSASGGAGIVGQGYSGGTSTGSGATGAAGGGGAGGTGGTGTVGGNGGNGGAGILSSITGTSIYYAGGGGGAPGATTNTAGTGGAGGGGNGGNPRTNASGGAANTGGGGGGVGGSGAGYAGGSGIVIIRYPGSQRAAGGTITNAGGYTIHTFTSSGTFIVW